MLSTNSTPSSIRKGKTWGKLTAFTHPSDDVILSHPLYYVYFDSLPSSIHFSHLNLDGSGILSQIYQDSQHRCWIESVAAVGTSVGDTKLSKGVVKQLNSGEKLYFYNSHAGAVNIVGYYFYPVNSEERSSQGSSRKIVGSLKILENENPQDGLLKLDQVAENEALCPACFKGLNPSETLMPCNHTFCASCIADVQKGSQTCPTCKVRVTKIKNNTSLKSHLHEVNLQEIRAKRKRENMRLNQEGIRKLSLEEAAEDPDSKRMKPNTKDLLDFNDDYLDSDNFNLEQERAKFNDFNNNSSQKGGLRKYTWPNGDIYIGEWKNQMRNGRGRFLWANGNMYAGTWKNDQKEGKGRIFYACGNIYEGEFKNDLENGRGKLTWSNGDVYKGDFKDGFAEGIGRVVYDNGEIYDGEWKKNKPEGRGVAKYANGDRYEGEWVDGRAEGKGKFIWATGDVYEGDFTNDQRDGQGRLKYANGNVYEGRFRYNQREGFGIFRWTNGEEYEGTWRNDQREGSGKLLNGNTLVYNGEWRHDKMKVRKPNLFKRIFRKNKKNKIHESPSIISLDAINTQ